MEPLVVTISEAAAALRISRSFFYELLKTEPTLRTVRIGKKHLFHRQSLIDYVEAKAGADA
jgi:excisionase family DNA binding protein